MGSDARTFLTTPQSTRSYLGGMAANRWTKCPQCNAFVYWKRLEKNSKVCPECNYHFHMGARERILSLLDPGSFCECDADLSPGDPLTFSDTKPYVIRVAENRDRVGEQEAAIYGSGTIDSQPVVVCALEFEFMGGSMGSVVGEKVTRAAERARTHGHPLIICSTSGGARMQEGVLSLMQMAKSSGALALLAEAGILYISVLGDPTYGGVTASFAMLGDIVVAEPHARIGFAGPSVIEQTIRQKLPEGFQTAEFVIEKGQIDMIVPRMGLPAIIKKLLLLHARRPVPASDPLPFPLSIAPPQVLKRSAWETVQLARHPRRPTFLDYVEAIFGTFTELHGERRLRDDPSIVGGLALLDGRPVMVIGHQKGRGTRGSIQRNFGMPHPEGYRKALRLMHHAARFSMPLLTFVDTPGAYPGIQAEERNQSEAIARNLFVMARLPVPIVSTIIGEGGSGGALAIAVCDRLLMLENAIYSVISPEGCATILFKDAAGAPRAAEASRITSRDLLHLGVAEEIIPEPEDGAQSDMASVATALKQALTRNLDSLSALSIPQLMERRYRRFRSYGEFHSCGATADL
jgi:acetyl-CoA carboxylase carboxyl transferase alpha subunit/acetyl-CoA carboxylase carboxyl transferase beta subunit